MSDSFFALKIGALLAGLVGGLLLAHQCGKWIYLLTTAPLHTPPHDGARESVEVERGAVRGDSDVERRMRLDSSHSWQKARTA